MKIIFFGTPQFVIPVLEVLNRQYDLVAVVTAPDKKIGRKQILTPSPVKQYALQRNIPIIEELKIENFKLKIPQIDLFVVAAYGKIIPKAILDISQYGAINIHPSKLPKYRGPSPITATILNGDKISAISFMKLDEQMDHGPILKTVPYEVPGTTTTETLTREIFQKSAELLPQVIDDYVAGKNTPVSQNHDEATYTHIITKQDGYIDLENPPSPEHLDRMIRAYFPWPTVWSRIHPGGGRLQRSESPDSRGVKLIKFLPEQKIQLEGGRPMTVKDFLNGYPELKEGVLGKIFHDLK